MIGVPIHHPLGFKQPPWKNARQFRSSSPGIGVKLKHMFETTTQYSITNPAYNYNSTRARAQKSPVINRKTKTPFLMALYTLEV